MFDYRWHCFLKEVLMSPCQPIGKIIDYFYRVEYQQRGSPHVHCLFWIEGAPQIDRNTDEEVVKFIDRYVTCELPSDDDTLLDTVSSVQTHSKRHSKSCRKHKTTCRFNFPKPVSARTFICRMLECKCDKKKTAETEPGSENRPVCKCFEDRDKMPENVAQAILTAVKRAVESDVPPVSVEDLFCALGINQEIFELAYRRLEKRHKVVYRRGVNEVWVNQYNKQLLKCWNANMDISFVTDAYAVVIYILSYITKAEREIGLLLTNAQKEAKTQGNLSAKEALRKLGSVYLHNRDVCAQEAVYRLTNMHLKECSRKVVFVPTGSRIVRMSLPLSVLRQKAASGDLGEDEMWMTGIVDRYKNRPNSDVFANMCMATFASEYRVLSKNEKSKDRIQLNNDLGFILRRTRTQFAVVRYMRFSLDRQEEAHFQSLLQLFLPYRTDSDLKPAGFELFEQFYNDGQVTFSDGSVHSVCDVVGENRARFEVNCPHLELAQEIAAQNNGVDEDVWGELCPEQETERLEGLEEQRQQREAEIAEEQLVEAMENVPDLIVGGRQVAQVERNRSMLSRSDGLALIRSLNETQLAVFYKVRQWCLQKVMGKNPEPLRVFVTGGAGTGKSHLIRAIEYEAGRLLSTLCDQPDDICVLLTAPTGIAAYNLNAATIHHTLSIGKQASLPYTPLGEDKLNSLRAKLSQVQILIIDEISMVDHNVLAYVHGRLRQVKQTGDFSPFGNVSVIAVGDFYQLPPVKGKPLYSSPVGVDLWCNFSIVELKKIVRQKDSVFAELLNRLRVRSRATPMLNSDVEMLKMRETGEVSSALHIFATNRQVSEHNLNYLFDCCPDYVTVEAQDFVNNRTTGNLERMPGHHGVAADTSLPETLCLARNARVMLCKNVDVADGLVNGACGTVTQLVFGEDSTFPLTVYVRFDDENIGSDRRKKRAHAAVECLQSTAIDPETERATKRGGVRRQFPLRLAWACTVHKVQGLTVDEAVVSLKRVFAPGQAYVALSRVRALSGLIIQDFTEKVIYCKDAIKEALDSMPPFLIEQPKPSLNTHSFSVYLMNVQNLSRHLVDLVSCTQHLQLTCIAVTETWLTAQSSLDCVQIEGYTFHSRPRGLCYSSSNPKLIELKNLEHGGVGLYSVDNLDCNILQVPDLNLECLVCLCNKFNILLVVIYRPPCYP
uniref:ATP-dependent DNA helicase n=1 Tax=Myripristis murdjan TaxID=586833 RepID=A0A667ZG45_9TELE